MVCRTLLRSGVPLRRVRNSGRTRPWEGRGTVGGTRSEADGLRGDGLPELCTPPDRIIRRTQCTGRTHQVGTRSRELLGSPRGRPGRPRGPSAEPEGPETSPDPSESHRPPAVRTLSTPARDGPAPDRGPLAPWDCTGTVSWEGHRGAPGWEGGGTDPGTDPDPDPDSDPDSDPDPGDRIADPGSPDSDPRTLTLNPDPNQRMKDRSSFSSTSSRRAASTAGASIRWVFPREPRSSGARKRGSSRRRSKIV